ncbi:MAG: hypothetical protein CL833_15155 [Crocinitomicaceae bacterium]|nr:hypothetical protein [Crocinitomicaceae bacterium]
MSSELKYQPEDIEFILLNKDFNELNKEERRFVDEFIKSEEEYLLMRKTLLNISKSVHPEVEIVPPYSIKDRLMAEFDEKERVGIVAWWNRMVKALFPENRSILAKPGIQMSLVVCSVLVLVIMIPWSDLGTKKENVAYNENAVKNEQREELQSETNVIRSAETEVEKEIAGEDAETNNTIASDEFMEVPEASFLADEVVSADFKAMVRDSVGTMSNALGDIDQYAFLSEKPASIEDISTAEYKDYEETDSTAISLQDDKLDFDEVAVSGNSHMVNSAEGTAEAYNYTSGAELLKETVVVSSESVSKRSNLRAKKETSLSPMATSRSLSDQQDLIDLLFTAM